MLTPTVAALRNFYVTSSVCSLCPFLLHFSAHHLTSAIPCRVPPMTALTTSSRTRIVFVNPIVTIAHCGFRGKWLLVLSPLASHQMRTITRQSILSICENSQNLNTLITVCNPHTRARIITICGVDLIWARASSSELPTFISSTDPCSISESSI